MGYIEFIGSDGIVSGSSDCSRKRHGDDHGNVRLGEHDGDYDGESGRCERSTVTDEPVTWVDRGNGNAHTDR